jgi:hypothetical protein
MKYLLLASIAVLLLGLLGLPPVFGRLAQSAVEARVAAIEPGGPLGVEIESYERGWFSSRALLAVTPRAATLAEVSEDGVGGTRPAAPSSARTMPVALHIDHGPVSLHDGFFFGFSRLSARGPVSVAADSENASASADSDDAPGPTDTPAVRERMFVFNARTGFDGGVHFTANVPSLAFAAASATNDDDSDSSDGDGGDGDGHDDGRVSVAGAQISGSLSGNRFTSHGRAASLELAGRGGALSLEDIELHTDGELLHDVGLPADIDLVAARATADLAGAADGGGTERTSNRINRIAVEHLALRSTLSHDESSQLLLGALELETDRISAGDRWNVTGLRIRTSVDRVDVAAIQRYSAAAAQLDGSDSIRAAHTAALDLAVKQVLAAGPTLSIDPLVFDVNGQPFEGMLDAAAQPAALSTVTVDVGDAAFWYRVIDGSLKLKAAKSLVESAGAAVIRRRAAEAAEAGSSAPFGNADTADVQAGLMLAVLATQGFLEDAGGNYSTTLRIENGAVTVNGRKLPFGLR